MSADVGFTGTQDGCTPEQRACLRLWFPRFFARGSVWMNNGDCIGSDEDAGTIWVELGGKLHLRPPDNPGKRAFQQADAIDRPLPYLERNKVIVRSSRALVATPKGAEVLRSGTWSTVRLARKVEMPILTIFPDGEAVFENWQRKAA